MAIHTTVVDALPDHAKRSGRRSVIQDAVDLAVATSPNYVRIESDSSDDLVKAYKSMIQYRSRHAHEVNLKMRKVKNCVYLWVEPLEESAA